MKTIKYIFGFVAIAAMTTLASCGSKNTENTVQETTDEETVVEEAAQEATLPPAEAPTDGSIIVLQKGQGLPIVTDKPVIVDFFATWCGPCQNYAPVFDAVAAQYADKAIFVRVDVDENPAVAGAFNVNAIPNTVALTTSAPVTTVGYMGEADLVQIVENAIQTMD